MRVFLTGATGFIGSAIVRELIDAGHSVIGLTRSEAGAKALRAAGAEAQRGDLQDLENLRAGAAQSDAVIHTAFNHDFSNYAANCESDRHVIEAIASALEGTDRPLIVTSATGMANTAPGRPATEDDAAATSKTVPRSASEEAAAAAAARGNRVMVMRLSQIHNREKQGLLTYAIQIAREKGMYAYVGDGKNRWPAAHLLDTARLYRLALEKGAAGANYHAVAEEGVPVKEMAEAIGAGLHVPVVSLTPEEAKEHFGWFAAFAGWDVPASSEKTRKQLGWKPTGPGIIADLKEMRF